MKKTVAFMTACLLSSTALKAGDDSPSQAGFFVGAQAGYNYLHTRIDTASNTTPNGIQIDTASNKKSKSVHSFIGGGAHRLYLVY